MASPILTLWEMIGGTPTPMTTEDFGTVDRGSSSVEKTIRFYNNKDGAGSVDPANGCKMTISDTGGGDSSPLIQGTTPDFTPFGRARCTSLCAGAKDVELGTGDGAEQAFDMPRGGSNTYVAGSMVAAKEVRGGLGGDNVTWIGSTWTIRIDEAGPDVDNPVTYLPPTIQPIPAGTTYYTAGAVVSYAGANPIITLDSDPSGPNGGLTPPGSDTPFVMQFRYKVTLLTGFTVVATGATAVITLDVAPELGCLVWGSFNYRTPEVTFEIVGGSANRMDIGGETTTLAAAAGLDQVLAIVEDHGYAEVVMRYDIAANAIPAPRLPFKFKVSTEV